MDGTRARSAAIAMQGRAGAGVGRTGAAEMLGKNLRARAPGRSSILCTSLFSKRTAENGGLPRVWNTRRAGESLLCRARAREPFLRRRQYVVDQRLASPGSAPF
eukprot:1767030-Prymnesium_polylepis.1